MLDILSLPFIQRALITGVLLGLTLAVLGVFVALRRAAFFGDAVAHFSFAGIAFGFLFAVNPLIAAIAISLLLSVGIVAVQHRAPAQSLDSIIGIFFSGSAALGIFVIGLLSGYRADLFQYLFGDVIAISPADLLVAAGVSLLTLGILLITWRPLFRIAFSREIAHVSGIRVRAYDYLFVMLLAMLTAVSIKIVGIILVPALLVIPAAAAKNISRSLRSLVSIAAIFGIASVLLGLFASFLLNTASGATIVLVSAGIFLITLVLRTK